MQNVKKFINSKRFTGGKLISSNRISDKNARKMTNDGRGIVNKPVYNLLINEFKIKNKEQIVKENKTRYTFKVHLRMISSAG